MAQVTDEMIARWRKLRGEGMVSAVGEYTPDEFWLVLDALEQARAKLAGVEAGTQIKRFTAYRRNISQRETHNELQKNPDDQPQYEGVIFTDGSVALRWRTAIHCTSVWSSLQDALNIHGHPEYGSEIIWHDGDTPPEWRAMLSASDSKEG